MTGSKNEFLYPDYFNKYSKRNNIVNHKFFSTGIGLKALAFFGGLYLFFYLKRPFKDYKIILVKDKKLLQEIYKFRYKIYCLTDNLLKASDYPDKLEYDNYDKYSYQFAILDINENVVGTFRLIHDSELKFPTEAEFDLEIFSSDQREKTVEISRLMVEKSYRKTMLLLDILRTIYQFSKSRNYEYWHGCAEGWFINTLNKVIGPLRIINKPKFCFNATNYPFLFKVIDLENNVKNKSRLILLFFKNKSKDIIIDNKL